MLNKLIACLGIAHEVYVEHAVFKLHSVRFFHMVFIEGHVAGQLSAKERADFLEREHQVPDTAYNIAAVLSGVDQADGQG